MPTYERSTTVTADADRLFAWLADVANLPTYMPSIQEAERDGDTIRTKARVETDGEVREYEGEATFETDESTRTMSWGAEGPNDYHGELEVEEDGDGAKVSVRITTERSAENDEDTIDTHLERTVAQIKRLVEEG